MLPVARGVRDPPAAGHRVAHDKGLDPAAAGDRDADTSRFDGVSILGVDEHGRHHVSTKPVEQGGRGPKEPTGMVDLTRNADGTVRTRLLDLVRGRSGQACTT